MRLGIAAAGFLCAGLLVGCKHMLPRGVAQGSKGNIYKLVF